MLLIIRPGAESFQLLSLSAVGSVYALAMRDLSTRRTPSGFSSIQLTFLGFFVIVPTDLALMIVQGDSFLAPQGHEWLYFFGAMLIGVCAYYAIVAATRMGM